VLEGRIARGAGISGLAAHVLNAHLRVEVVQVGGHIGITEGVDNRDGDSLALVAELVERRQVVGILHGSSGEAPPAHLEAGAF
jgi:hypothetical protein